MGGPVYFLLHTHCLEQWPAHNKPLVNVSGLNEHMVAWVDELKTQRGPWLG